MIGVTGSTGQLGRMVAGHLADAGLEQRLLVRDVARAPAVTGATVVGAGTYADGHAAARALAGVDVLFMVSAHEGIDRVEQHRTFIGAAAAAGVRHIVYTSFAGASPSATFTLARDHWATEQALRASGLGHTILRDSLYLDVLPYFGGDDGVIRGPAGEGRIGAVARADVARAAAAVLRNPSAHTSAVYELTGPEALTLAEVASAITAHTGRLTRFHDETEEEAYASRARYNAPPWQVEAWVSTYLAIRNGEMAAVTPAVHTLTGRAPLSLQQFLSMT